MKLLNNYFMYYFSILIGLIDKFFSINMLCVFFPYIYIYVASSISFLSTYMPSDFSWKKVADSWFDMKHLSVFYSFI